MSALIFCSFEVGGLPFRYAETLNRLGIPTFYVSLATGAAGHNSTGFHYGGRSHPWDLSEECRFHKKADVISGLRRLKDKYGIEACFATGHLSYLLDKAGLRYKYWCYGSDLDQLCFFPHPPAGADFFKPKSWKDFLYCALARPKARAAICRADAVIAAPYQEAALNDVCPRIPRFFLPHLIATQPFEQVWHAKKAARQSLRQQHQAENLFFSSVRHYWEGVRAHDSDNKGNNKVLEAFAHYLRLSGHGRDKLILVAKGPDVAASQAMAESLGLMDHVVWQGEMPREQLATLYSGATLCLGQFGTPVLTYAALEPLASGTPCASYYMDRAPSPAGFYEKLPPIWNSKEPNEIAEVMVNVAETPEDEYKTLCASSWQWIYDNCSEVTFARSFAAEFHSSVGKSG
ncbi:MAG: glycosyltransferase [Magnetospirillum sp.]|nr:glycosyltransferase [Magnetospirillum sp.]